MCDWPAWLAARPVARMNEAKSGNERNAAPRYRFAHPGYQLDCLVAPRNNGKI